jgi:hypothetical protein
MQFSYFFYLAASVFAATVLASPAAAPNAMPADSIVKERQGDGTQPCDCVWFNGQWIDTCTGGGC